MRPLILVTPVVLVCLGPGWAAFSQAGTPDHAPDFRAIERIAPLTFPPKADAPFMAVAKTTWVRNLPDGSTITTQNERVVTRDAEGRIFQERRTFTPVPDVQDQKSEAYINVYSDPVEHTLYNCRLAMRTCELFPYYEPVDAPLTPAGLQPDGMTFLTRENLGVDTFEGMEVQRSREVFTHYIATIGNTKTVLRTIDYWYSPALDVNVKVVRHDPRDGDQTLWLTDISMQQADAEIYKPPAGFHIIDHRVAGAGPGNAVVRTQQGAR
jgi:hypothetical protein